MKRIYLAEKHGLRTIEVPITEIYVEDGSTRNPWRHGFGNLGTIISWISEKRPLFFMGLPELQSRLSGWYLVHGLSVAMKISQKGIIRGIGSGEDELRRRTEELKNL